VNNAIIQILDETEESEINCFFHQHLNECLKPDFYSRERVGVKSCLGKTKSNKILNFQLHW